MDMDGFLAWVVTSLGGLWLSVISWGVRMHYHRLEKLEARDDTLKAELTRHQLYVARNYATLQRVEQMESRILDKLDAIVDKLNTKADK